MSAMQRRPFVFALGVALMVGGGCQLPKNHPAAAATKDERLTKKENKKGRRKR
jgi:hypothetical protein